MDNFAKMDRRVKRYFTLNNEDKRIKKSLFNTKNLLVKFWGNGIEYVQYLNLIFCQTLNFIYR